MIKINSKALKKILFHSLLFGREKILNNEYKMVLGLLGGKNVKDEVQLHDVCLSSHGEISNVRTTADDQVRLALFDEKITKNKSFTIGWYCSIPNDGHFFNHTNYKTQIGYQTLNPLAIATVVYPEKYQEDNIQEYFKVYRLKENLIENWIELSFEIVEENGNSVDYEIQNNFPKLYKKLDMEDLNENSIQELLDTEYDIEKQEINFY